MATACPPTAASPILVARRVASPPLLCPRLMVTLTALKIVCTQAQAAVVEMKQRLCYYSADVLYDIVMSDWACILGYH